MLRKTPSSDGPRVLITEFAPVSDLYSATSLTDGEMLGTPADHSGQLFEDAGLQKLRELL